MTQIVQEERLRLLRTHMAEYQLAAYLIPKADEFQLEYVPACNDRLAWLTEFTGSAGLAIVGSERAALFTDSRYTEQARAQSHAPAWEQQALREGPTAWLKGVASTGDTVGYNPRVHTPSNLAWLRELAARQGLVLRAIESNLVDKIWLERPPAPRSPIEQYPEGLAGESTASKRQRMGKRLREFGADAAVITDPANLAWLLNIRAQDLAHTPLALGVCILGANGSVRVFLDPCQWTPAAQAEVAVNTPGETRFEALADFDVALSQYSGQRIRVARSTASEWIIDSLRTGGATVEIAEDPCTLAKACKTTAELAAIRTAHVRDGVALTRFLHWLSTHWSVSETEWTLAAKLDEFRRIGEHYRSLSFRTISAFGPSAASPHYTVAQSTARRLSEGSLYLVDSGGQYLDGTTDVTRVVAIGTPSLEMCQRYTQVLRGHIAISRAQFPKGVTGNQLDPLARQFLWAQGVDYGHGTGHGVGCFLSVHEGPQGISPRPNQVALTEGMVVSNEPGYYKPGHFGIRIENLLAVVKKIPQPEGAEATTLSFETLTLSPYERELIVTEELSLEELHWVDTYHQTVLSSLAPLLPDDTRQWLQARTAPLEGSVNGA